MSFQAKKSKRQDGEMAKALEEVGKEPSTRLNVEIPESSMKLLKKIVAEKGTKIKDYVNEILEKQLQVDAESLNIK